LTASDPEQDPGDQAIRSDMIAVGLQGDIEAASTLTAYLKLLGRWNATYNLTGTKDPALIRTQHLVDCMAAVPLLRRIIAGQSPIRHSPIRLLDVGSGAGLPGIVLAILHPAWQIDCVDAVGKKAAFIRQAAGQLTLSNVRAIHARVESIAPPSDGYDLIISRAFSSLRDFVDLTRTLLKQKGIWVAMKGKIPKEELEALPEGVVVRDIQQIDVPGLTVDRCLVVLEVKH
jgi:16S rRNA (guanine527-N7)-methyltransferase